MKRSLFITAMLALCAQAYAAEPLQLVITTAQGVETAFDAAGLTLSVSSGTLNVTNGTQSATYDLSSLNNMYFVNGSTGLAEAVSVSAAPVDVYSVSGVHMGAYSDAEAAEEALPAGVYVVSDGDNTYKIRVK